MAALDSIPILVTGACGQVGIAIIQLLQAQCPTAEIHAVDLNIPAPTSPRYVPNITYHCGDVTDVENVGILMRSVRPTVVFHTAGLIPQVAERLGCNDWEGFEKVNVGGTKIVLEQCKKVGSVKSFVYTSSCDVVKAGNWTDLRGVDEGQPIPTRWNDPYSKSKAMAESFVLSSSTPVLPTTAIRTHGVFSAYDNNMLPWLLSAPRNIHLGSGKNLYDYTYAPNLALGHMLAAINLLTIHPADTSNIHSAAGKPFFITNAEPCHFRVFLTAVWKAYDADLPERKDIGRGTTIPKNVALPLVWMNEKVSKISGKKPLLTTKDLGDSTAERFFDNTRAREVLGYQPSIKLADAIEEAVRGYKIVVKQEGESR
ncbi:hypothetical protein BP6252_00296 [Coleophoma cylindrospora]|uniref:3-beta hydroxysteroid dehydrogenase/isomerase domain-containing protein n=1 Tax=Coleophoma cylindrospora TaxID=1849047 RepID=A0A3D8SQ00_9HELO|nr:hypothetical protein BP6252_00296 [Coleophoma cylindrospora]